MIRILVLLFTILTTSTYSAPVHKNKIEVGGFGVFTTGYEEVNGVIIVRPVFRYYANNWFFISPVYNLKHFSIYDGNRFFDSQRFSSYTLQHFGLSVGANIKPVKYFGVSLASGTLLQHYSQKSAPSWNHFALSADISLAYYLREYLTIGINYYLTADIFNDSELPDGGLTLGFTYFL